MGKSRFTYYKILELGWPATRLQDYEWRQRFRGGEYPQPPVWTESFRIPVQSPPEFLRVPLE